MRSIEQDCRAVVSAIIATVVFMCVLTSAYGQVPNKRTTGTTNNQGPLNRGKTETDQASHMFTSVPNVVGMYIDAAVKTMSDAGRKWRITYLPQPNPSFRRGYVSAVVPEVGSLVRPLDEIELRVPLAASLMGKGNLGLSDIERRMGFDLDTGRFEEMCSGADFLLLKLGKWHDPGPSYPGSSQYFTSDLVMSATGGAKLAPSGLSASETEGALLGSYQIYRACENMLGPYKRDTSLLSVFDLTQPSLAYVMTACVRTSKGQIGAVSFSTADNAGGLDPDISEFSYIFRWALFEKEPPLRPAERREVKP